MAANATNLSPTKLKDLKSGETISIRYATSQDAVDSGASRIIFDQFPKRVATTFSSSWAGLFPAINKISIKDLSLPKRTSITVVGGDMEIVKSILVWMMSCCEGKGMTAFPHDLVKPFYNSFVIKQSADNMGIKVLSQEMDRRLKDMASKQIHSEDVRAMYLNLPADHPILKDIATHIADLIRTRRLRASSAYKTVREEIPRFDADINAILGERTTRTPSSANINRSSNKPTHPNQKKSNRTQYSNQSVEPQTQHTTIRCPVVRKAGNGRPTYVKLSLADAGIKRDEFIGGQYTQPQRQKQQAFAPAPAPKTQSQDAGTQKVKKTSTTSTSTSTSSGSDSGSDGKDTPATTPTATSGHCCLMSFPSHQDSHINHLDASNSEHS